MKFKAYALILLAAVLFLSPNLLAAEAAKMAAMYVENPVYEFELALDGDEVKHDFLVRNKGDAILYIMRVHTG